MKIRISILSAIAAIGISTACVSCGPNYETDFDKSTLIVPHKSQAMIVFEIGGGEKEIAVETNVPLEKWTAESNAAWCEVAKSDAKVTVKAGAYDGYRTRQAQVSVYYGHQKYNITVLQMGKSGNLDIAEEKGIFERKKGTIAMISATASELDVPLVTNLDVDHVQVPDTCTWVHYDASQPMEKDANGYIHLKLGVDNNKTSKDRYCTLILQSSMNFDIIKELLIIQAKNGFVVTPVYGDTPIDVEDAGEHLRIPFKHDFTDRTFTVEIESAAQTWIKQVGGSNVVSGDNLELSVEPNEVQLPRSGTVKLTSTNNPAASFTVTIRQKAFVPVPPVNVENLQATSGNGSITLTWSIPEKVNYTKIVATCYNPTLNKTVTKEIINKNATSVVFTPTYAFAGEYQFTVKTYGITGLETLTPQTVKAVSGPWKENVEIPLTVEMITANATQVNDGGGIPALVDRNRNTYYHSLWESLSPGRKPHYLQIELDDPSAKEFYFEYDGRISGNPAGDVKRAKIYGSQVGVDNDAAWTELGEITFNLPESAGGHGTSKAHIKTNERYRYLRFVPTARRNLDPLNAANTGDAWWNMGELYYYEVHDEAWVQSNP